MNTHTMDEKTKILISIGAAVAANCIPCFEHLYYRAVALKLNALEIQEVIEIAEKVKSGAHIAIKSAIQETMNQEPAQTDLGSCPCGCI